MRHYNLYDLDITFPVGAMTRSCQARVRALSAEQAIAHAYKKILCPDLQTNGKPLAPIDVRLIG